MLQNGFFRGACFHLSWHDFSPAFFMKKPVRVHRHVRCLRRFFQRSVLDWLCSINAFSSMTLQFFGTCFGFTTAILGRLSNDLETTRVPVNAGNTVTSSSSSSSSKMFQPRLFSPKQPKHFSRVNSLERIPRSQTRAVLVRLSPIT